jgi:hypothetical protein
MSQPSVDPLFCIVADGTRVEKDHIGGGRVGRKAVSFLPEDPSNELGVSNVHLTSVGLDVYQAWSAGKGHGKEGFMGMSIYP